MRTRLLSLILLTCLYGSTSLIAQNRNESNQEVYRIGNVIDYVRDNGYKHRTIAVDPNNVHVFSGLIGPMDETIVPPRHRTSWKEYAKGATSRLSVLLLDTTSTWLGLVNGLNAHSIPFKITTDVNEAIKHSVIILYPGVSSKDINLDIFQKLKGYLHNGGVLIGFSLMAPSLGELFGYNGTDFSASRAWIRFDPTVSKLTSMCNTSLEREVRVGNFEVSPYAYETCAYLQPEYKPLARYEDGQPAIVQKLYNNGLALAIGIDLGHFTLVSHFNYDASFQRSVANGFEPTLDMFYRMIREVYLLFADQPIVLGMVPDNKQVSIVITHDVDTKDAVPNSLIYADLEKSMGVPATYNIQTKYITDGQDSMFFTDNTLKYFKALRNMGMEVASHSVSHTPFFNYIPMGTGKEAYPAYQPLYVTTFSTFNETMLGELRVSKFLLEELLDVHTVSFRAGYLDYAPRLHEALEATGYHYSSSVLANDVLTHLPYQTVYDDNFTENVDVYEIPVTIEDEELPPMYERLSQAVFVTDQIGEYGGVVNVLIHPNELGQKLEFLREYIDQYKGTAWFGTMNSYGDWFRAKCHLQLDVVEEPGRVKIHLHAPYLIRQLPVHIPPGMRVLDKLPGRMEIRQDGNCLVLDSVVGNATITLTY